MSFWRRVAWGISGKAKRRLPRLLRLLDAPTHLVEEANGLAEEAQEAALLSFISGRLGCALDWRARRDDVLAELVPLLSDQERRLLPAVSLLPDDAGATIKAIRRAMAPLGRTLVQTESLGDFSILLIVPASVEQDVVAVVGPWLID